MLFWGVEVKSGEPLEVEPDDGYILHLSQACIGETKKDKGGKDPIHLYVNIDKKKVVLGTLSTERPNLVFDLIFEKSFELSHNWKNGSVYFSGYRTPNQTENPFLCNSDSDSDEDLSLGVLNNGELEAQAKLVKPAAAKANAIKPDAESSKQKVKIVEPNKDAKPSENAEESSDDVESSDDDDDEFESDEDEEMPSAEKESDEEDDDSDEEDEETPKKAEPSKKRPADSSVKTPGNKKAKLVTPPKTERGKGVVHVATPYPKQAGKTPANNDKSKQQQSPKSSKSGGSFLCKTCSRTFNSDAGLQSHTKAKHTAAK